MLVGIMDELREKRASFERDLKYIRECNEEDVEDAAMESAESMFFKTTIEDYEEAALLVDEMSLEGQEESDAAEVKRIMESTKDLTFDEMIGLDS